LLGEIFGKFASVSPDPNGLGRVIDTVDEDTQAAIAHYLRGCRPVSQRLYAL
jgi:hypothetical protein